MGSSWTAALSRGHTFRGSADHGILTTVLTTTPRCASVVLDQILLGGHARWRHERTPQASCYRVAVMSFSSVCRGFESSQARLEVWERGVGHVVPRVRGERSSVGRALGCGPSGRGFESRRSPLRRGGPPFARADSAGGGGPFSLPASRGCGGMADALDLGSGVLDVEVRVLSPALNRLRGSSSIGEGSDVRRNEKGRA
jgi:hypothetical protein